MCFLKRTAGKQCVIVEIALVESKETHVPVQFCYLMQNMFI